MLMRRGVLIEEMGQTDLAEPDADGEEARTLRPLQAAACTYRIAFDPRAGQKVLTVQGAMPREMDFKQMLCADIDGFSLHAAVRCRADDRQGLEQLCRYITRPALANERVQTNAAGQVVLKLKTAWRDGTTHLVMSPLEFMRRLAALVPQPRPYPRVTASTRSTSEGRRLPRVAMLSSSPRRPAVQPEHGPTAAAGVDRELAVPARSGYSRTPVLSKSVDALGPTAQTRLRHRHTALSQLRLCRAQYHRGHLGAAGDREDPHPPGAGAATAAQGGVLAGQGQHFRLYGIDGQLDLWIGLRRSQINGTKPIHVTRGSRDSSTARRSLMT